MTPDTAAAASAAAVSQRRRVLPAYSSRQAPWTAVRTRAIERKLRDVQALPAAEVAELLGDEFQSFNDQLHSPSLDGRG